MNKIAAIVLAAAMLAGLAAPAPAAGEISPEKMRLATKYWRLHDYEKTVYRMLAAMQQRMLATAPEKEKAKVRDSYRKIVKGIKESGVLKRIAKQGVPLTARYFTVGELKAMIKFFTSPEGRSIMNKMPQFGAASNQLVLKNLLPVIQRIMREEMEREGRGGKGAH